MVAQFVDISGFQPTNIDWATYRKWSAQVDGISRVSIKATEGVGFIDPHFQLYRQAAIDAGIDVLLLYHFARPDLGNNPVDEAKFMHSVVGNVRDSDILILDYEVNAIQATSEWAHEWLAQQEDSYDGKLPGLYASSAYIQARLQDARLSKYPLWLANWQFSPDARPPVPKPWTTYQFVQYTDNATNIPGIPGAVDCNIFLGGTTPMSTTVPSGWTDDGHTLKAPNGIPVVLGFRQHILADPTWSPNNWPLEPEHHVSSVEQSHPSLGGGQVQLFRWKRLEYTASGGIIEGWLGQELLWYQQQHDILQDQLTQLLALNADLHEKLAELQSDNLAEQNAALQAKINQAIKILS